MRVLVTGSEGFVGPHLMAALRARGAEVLGTSRDGTAGPPLDLPNDSAAGALLDELRPHAVVHLAAISNVPIAASDPEATWRTNVDGVRSIHRALLEKRPEATFLFVSSGAVYGPATPGEGPADESRPCRPTNVYAWTKLAAEAWLQTVSGSGPRVVIARPFNHAGPGQTDDFALPSFARQIIDAERNGGSGEIRTGNLDAERDFLDVRDVVHAYLRLLESGETRGVYNVCSGATIGIGALLEALRAGSEATTTVHTEAARQRQGDTRPVTGSSDRLRRETGWEPRHSTADMIRDILADWRERLADVI